MPYSIKKISILIFLIIFSLQILIIKNINTIKKLKNKKKLNTVIKKELNDSSSFSFNCSNCD